MKTRTITGIFIALFIAPFVIFNGYVSFIYITLFLLLGVYELLNIKKKASLEAIPIYMYVLAFIFGFLVIYDIPGISTYCFNYHSGVYDSTFGVNYLWLLLFLVTFFACSIFDKRISIVDSLYVFGTTFYLSMCLKAMLFVKSIGFNDGSNLDIYMMLFVILASFATDIFAYLGGMGLRKIVSEDKLHKLNVRISPKKTIEGAIIGTIFGTVLSSIVLCFLIKAYNYPISLLISFGLSIFSQLGDLIFSAIKRHFNVKDYSNLLPGHGGLLDRIDSLLLVNLVFVIFTTLI